MTHTRRNIHHVHELEELDSVKMTTLPKGIHRLNEIPIKIPIALFTELGQLLLKICTETQKNPNSQNNLKKEQNWRCHTPISNYSTEMQ